MIRIPERTYETVIKIKDCVPVVLICMSSVTLLNCI